MKKRINKRKCLHCRAWFRPKRWGNAKTCGARCARKRWDQRNRVKRKDYNRRAYERRKGLPLTTIWQTMEFTPEAARETLNGVMERIGAEMPLEDVRMSQEVIREVEAGQETGDMPVERTSVLGRLLSRREG